MADRRHDALDRYLRARGERRVANALDKDMASDPELRAEVERWRRLEGAVAASAERSRASAVLPPTASVLEAVGAATGGAAGTGAAAAASAAGLAGGIGAVAAIVIAAGALGVGALLAWQGRSADVAGMVAILDEAERSAPAALRPTPVPRSGARSAGSSSAPPGGAADGRAAVSRGPGSAAGRSAVGETTAGARDTSTGPELESETRDVSLLSSGGPGGAAVAEAPGARGPEGGDGSGGPGAGAGGRAGGGGDAGGGGGGGGGGGAGGGGGGGGAGGGEPPDPIGTEAPTSPAPHEPRPTEAPRDTPAPPASPEPSPTSGSGAPTAAPPVGEPGVSGVTGTIVHRSGRSLAGREITLWAHREGAAETVATTTALDARGRYTLTLSAGEWWVRADPNDARPAWADLTGGGPSPIGRAPIGVAPDGLTHGVDLVLEDAPERSARGRALRADGNPAAHALVSARAGGDGPWLSALTGADGEFDLPIEPGVYTLGLSDSLAGAPRWWLGPDGVLEDSPVHLDAGALDGIVLQLP